MYNIVFFVLMYYFTHFRITLESNLKSKENDYPAVLLLASTTKVVPTSHCIARKLSAAFSTACHRFVEVNIFLCGKLFVVSLLNQQIQL